MKNRVRNLFLMAVFVILGKMSFAQLSSTNAVGVRFGTSTGLSFRHALSEDRAVEGIMSVQSNSKSSRFRLLGLYQYHKPLVDNFSWYYGFGGSIGSYKYKAFTDANGNRVDSNSEMSLSVDGIVGAEYNIPEAPIALSLDIKPYFDFIQESSIRFKDALGFTIRYKF